MTQRTPSSPMRAVASLLSCAVLSIAAVSCGGGEAGPGAADATAQAGGLVGQAAPDFAAEPVTGDGPKSLKEAQGKVVILDFWATFCEPCKKSFPKYQEIVDQFGGQVSVLAVSVDEADTKKDDIAKFAKDAGVKFAIVWDKDQTAAKKYMPPKTAKMPTAFIIDKTGVVRHIHPGFEDGEETKIAAEVKALIGK